MLVWLTAAKAPSAMDAIERKTMICCHWPMSSANGLMSTRVKSAIAATLGAAAKNAVTGVGAPSYTSGVHMWNGTAAILNARPAERNTSPTVRPNDVRVASANRPPSTSKRVVPEKP